MPMCCSWPQTRELDDRVTRLSQRLDDRIAYLKQPLKVLHSTIVAMDKYVPCKSELCSGTIAPVEVDVVFGCARLQAP